jgi:hypothetical protein
MSSSTTETVASIDAVVASNLPVKDRRRGFPCLYKHHLKVDCCPKNPNGGYFETTSNLRKHYKVKHGRTNETLYARNFRADSPVRKRAKLMLKNARTTKRRAREREKKRLLQNSGSTERRDMTSFISTMALLTEGSNCNPFVFLALGNKLGGNPNY